MSQQLRWTPRRRGQTWEACPDLCSAQRAECRAIALRGLVLGGLIVGMAWLPLSAAPPQTRQQALQGLAQSDARLRVAALARLAEVGTMADGERVARQLRSDNPVEREAAAASLWAIWSRSGDAGIDAKLRRGTNLMDAGNLALALAQFDEIVRLKPDFAEGWNKRATVLYLMSRDAESLRDCDQVLRRNPQHFGALSGMAQIHLRGGDVEAALAAYERLMAITPHQPDGQETLRQLRDAVRSQRRAAGSVQT